MSGPIKVHVDNQGIIDGSRKGERVYQAKSGRCRFMEKIGEELHGLAERGISLWKWHMSRHTARRKKKKK